MTPDALPASGSRILIVEDEPEVAAMVADVLRARGYDVETAADGALALQAVGAWHFDLVLSDVAMPGLDGVELYRAIEARHAPLIRRFAFMSAAASRVDLVELLRTRGVPLLHKPFLIRDLLGVVERLLSSR